MRGSRPGKTVQMTESEVRGLCLKSREIFLQQPILLELEAPLKICGKKKSVLRTGRNLLASNFSDAIFHFKSSSPVIVFSRVGQDFSKLCDY